MTQTVASGQNLRDRLVVVGANGAAGVIDGFSAQHPDWDVVRSESLLSGIAEASKSPARAILSMIEPGTRQIFKALEGFRAAAGPETRIILCCKAESEPLARAALNQGADEYIVWPMEVAELEAAIGIVESAPPIAETSANADETAALAEAVEMLDGRPRELLQKLADIVRQGVTARGVTLAMQGAGATAGEPVTRGVIVVPIASGSKGNSPASGQIVVGEKTSGAYTPGDIARLASYAKLIGHLLAASARQRQWRELAITDIGSGLPNRRYLHEQLPPILERAIREHFAVTVLLFDVDNFKSFNDRHGHDAGDEILRVVGQLFRKTCREQDIVTRYGGDEFAVVFWDPSGPREPGSRHPQQALSVVDRFTEALRSQRFSRLGPEGGTVTISGGLATYPWDASSMDELLSKADQALLSAKRAGKNRVVVVG